MAIIYLSSLLPIKVCLENIKSHYAVSEEENK